MNSIIIIAKNIKLDKNYTNVVNYTEQQMLNLIENNKVAKANDYSFIRQNRNTISVNFDYSDCLKCNYMAFQNKDYSNKWFFAWIDDVIYKGNNCTEILYTIDSWSTFFNDCNINDCLVVREHTNDDTIGSNTQNEDVSLGDSYIIEKESVIDYSEDMNLLFIATDTYTPSGSEPQGKFYNGVYSSAYTASAGTASYDLELSARNIDALIKPWISNGTEERLISITQYPEVLGDLEDLPNMYVGNYSNINIINNFDGYIPKNKKLLTYPYKKLKILSSSGSETELLYELFENNKPEFLINGTILPTTTMSLIPKNYQNIKNNYTKNVGLDFNIPCSWIGDSYSKWYLQNKNDIALKGIESVLNIGVGIASSYLTKGAFGGGNIVSGVSGLVGLGAEIDKARKQSDTLYGNTSAPGLQIAQKRLGFIFTQMCIKKEYAIIIDNYFTKYGYATNRLKKPNIVGRKYFNYVMVGNNEIVCNGDVPSKYIDDINNAFKSGVTIWHNHNNIGNYTLDNNIV